MYLSYKSQNYYYYKTVLIHLNLLIQLKLLFPLITKQSVTCHMNKVTAQNSSIDFTNFKE